jgi:hypothetical protein
MESFRFVKNKSGENARVLAVADMPLKLLTKHAALGL